MEVMQKSSSPALLLALDQLASYYRTDGKAAEWEKIADQLSGFFPDNLVTLRELRLLAARYMNKGEFPQAIAAYERFAKQLNAEDRQNLDLARAMMDSGADGYAIVKSANAQLEGNNPELAARLYREALRKTLKDDEKFEAMTKMGWCLYLRNREKESEKLWKKVVASAPKGNEWRGKSRWHLVVLNAGDHNDTKKAIELCEEQAKEFTSGFMHGQALFSKAWLLWTQSKWKEAREAFNVLIREYPEKATHPPIMKYIEDCDNGMSARR
jgi:tetratricopeptide (TPR) repeat protein